MRWRPTTRGLVLAVVIVAMVLSFALWATASDGTKQEDLGAQLLGTGIIGLLLLFFERAYSARTRELGEVVSLAPAPSPATDVAPQQPASEEETGPRHIEVTLTDRIGLSDEVATELQPGPHVFTVEYDGWQRDTQRIDASRARLRVYRDDAYFQFYTAIVSGIGLRAL